MPQRSPLIFWLLIAATVSVDAVVLFSYSSRETLFIQALVNAQLGVVCVWSVLNPTKNLWVTIAPIVAVIIAALFMGAHSNAAAQFRDQFSMYLPFFGLDVALVWIATFAFRHSPYWRRRNRVAERFQFSIAHLLIIMAVVGLLAAAMRDSPYFNNYMRSGYFYWSIGSALLVIAAVFFWDRPWHALLRLSAVLGSALVLSSMFPHLGYFLEGYNFVGPFFWRTFQLGGVYYLIQGITLFVWMGCGPIIPLRETPGASAQL